MSAASQHLNAAEGLVSSYLDTVRGWSNSARNVAEGALDGLGSFDLPNIQIDVPADRELVAPTGSVSTSPPEFIQESVDPRAATYQSVGGVATMTAPMPGAPTYETHEEIGTPPTPNLPMWSARPSFVAAPVDAVPDTTLPDEPIMTKPASAALLAIVVPDYVFPTLSEFTLALPEDVTPFVDIDPSSTITPFSSVWLDNLLARCIQFMNGEGMSVEDEERLAAMVASESEIEAQKLIRAAEADYAAKGFDTAPGTLLDKVVEIELAAGKKIRQASAKARDEAAKMMQENQKVALGATLALEKAFSEIALEEARQLLAIEQLKVKAAMTLFNASIEMFNAKQRARSAYGEAFKARVSAYLQAVSATKLVVEGAVAKTAANEALVDMYAADVNLEKARTDLYTKKVSGLTLELEAFKVFMQGVMSQADIDVANMTAYKHEVGAYASAVSAANSAVKGITSYYRAAVSGIEVYDANARAASEFSNAASRVVSAYGNAARSQSDVFSANVQSFRTASDANKAYYQAKLAEVKANTDMFNDRASAYGQALTGLREHNGAIGDFNEASQATGIVRSENDLRQQSIDSLLQSEQDKLDAAVAGARATVAASLASGAMSAIHISAKTSGSSELALKGTRAYDFTAGTSGSISHTKTVTIQKK